MMSLFKSVAGVAGLSAAMILAGCQTAQRPAPQSALVQTPQGLLACRDCRVSTRQDPINDPKGRLVGYRPQKVMECPDCADVEETLGESGTMTRHTCVTCDESIVICSLH